jgi:glycosyltransferase involved in cell wall biosynthesis
MHIAIVAPEFPPEIGGIQTYAAEFAKELVGRGHRVTVFTRRRAEAQSNLPDMDIRGVLTGRAVADLPHFRGIQADAWHVMNAAYAWLALHFKPTVVSIHGNDFLRPYIPAGEPELSAVPGLWRAPGLRLAIEQHVGAWRTPRLVRAGLGRASRILANSRYTEQVFLAQFPECAGRTQAAMVGVGADFLREGEKKSVHPIPQLITVCRLSERRKNVDLVLRALALLKDRYEFRYLVVGDGEIRAELEALTDELGLAGRVEFAGFLSAEVLRDRLAQSDLFVLVASINQHSHEGFGIAYLEANACGTPALAANLAGAAEAVQAGASGFFADGLGVESVAAALQRFLSGELRFDPAACRAFARRFTWQQVVDQAMPWYGQPQQLVRRVALASHGGEGLT